ncbi:MAG TPA: hypothetical protein VGB59_02275 [Allosphingosinicella sp.]|jgi:hypothetical protein
MTERASILLRLAALSAAVALAGCGGTKEQNLASLENEADPALASALNDQILVDPNLTAQSNKNAVRPPATPTQAHYPPPAPAGASTAATAAAGAKGGNSASPAAATVTGASASSTETQHAQLAGAAAGRGGTACSGGARFDYNMGWANRLPAAFPLYPGARVTEAAGNNQGDCRVRAITFTTSDGWQRVLDWYHTRAVRAGYSSEHQLRQGDHVLAGSNERDGGAFYLIVSAKGSGSEVALIANKGR